MKKNYFLSFALVSLLTTVSAQITLIQNTDNVITATNSVACPGGDNLQSREFDLSAFGVTGEFELTNGEVGVQSNDIAMTVTVNIYDSDGSFPTGFPGSATLLGSQDVNIPIVTAGGETIVSYNFAPTIVVPGGAGHIVVEVSQPLPGIQWFIGGTTDETASSWVLSNDCAVTPYSTTDSIGFPDAHYYITVTGDETLSFDDFEISKVLISPNPSSDVVNIRLHPSNSVMTIQLYNITGQLIYESYNETQLNISDLHSGVYLLQVETENGSATKRLVKN